MSSQPVDPAGGGSDHPVAALVERLDRSLADTGGMPLLSMSAPDMRRTLVRLAAARARLDALALRLLADAEATQACTEAGASTAAAWLAGETRQTGGRAGPTWRWPRGWSRCPACRPAWPPVA